MVLFIIYGELTISETKCIINNLIRQLSHGDCSYSLYQSQQSYVVIVDDSVLHSTLPHYNSYLSYPLCVYRVFTEVRPSKSIPENNHKNPSNNQSKTFAASMLLTF